MQFMNSLSSSMLVVLKKKRVNLFSYSVVFNTFYKTKKVLCWWPFSIQIKAIFFFIVTKSSKKFEDTKGVTRRLKSKKN
jgi:hypothetical protein